MVSIGLELFEDNLIKVKLLARGESVSDGHALDSFSLTCSIFIHPGAICGINS